MGRAEYLVLLILMTSKTSADIYMHNPRGSNNRLDENTRQRNNANRLFDSQNNDRGGYNVGSLYYLVDSELGIEWTNQHSCADENNHCEIVIQYMCSDLLRDGISKSTIPENPAECEDNDCNSDIEYGMHEDFYYYAHCKLRSRNKGLFSADQKLKGESAKYTRQNPGGTRRGYECPEERDHYPYWHPTPWKDIAVLTNDVRRCKYYQTESQNVKSKWACEVPYQYLYRKSNQNVEDYIPVEKEKCEAFDAEATEGKPERGVWKEYPAHDLPPPACGNTIPSRDNHLGNTLGGYHAMFNWTIFDDPSQSCALRIRYNISTAEYDGWNITSALNNRQTAKSLGPDIWTDVDLTETEAKEKQYYLKQNPEVDVFGTNGRNKNFRLRLAINTAQFGRTFQDRSHKFSIRKRTSDVENAKIHNLNVRGKRGNIVQVYPAVEYDYTPQVLRVAQNDFVHFQWTGSNDNPDNNDGQGEKGTDRSNLVPMKTRAYPEGDPTKAQSYTYGHAGVSYPANVLSSTLFGLDNQTKQDLASLYNVGGVMEELDDAGTYFDIGPRKVTMVGDFNFMCTRNNNFSNRSQKGKLVVKKSRAAHAYIGELGGNVTISGTEGASQTAVHVPPNSLASSTKVTLEVIDDGEVALKSRPPNQDYVSNFVHLSQNTAVSEGNSLKMTVSLKSGTAIGSLFEPVVYRTTDDENWISLKVDSASSSAVNFDTDSGGHFVVSKAVAAGPMAGLVIGCLVGVILIGVVIFYCRTSKLPLAGYSSKV